MFVAYKRLFDLYYKIYKEDNSKNRVDLRSFYQIKLLGMLSLMYESGVIGLEKYLSECDILYEKFI